MKWSKSTYKDYKEVVDSFEDFLNKKYPKNNFKILSYNIMNNVCYINIQYKVDVTFYKYPLKDIIETELTIYQTKNDYILRVNHRSFIYKVNKDFNLDHMIYSNEDIDYFDHFRLPHTLRIIYDEKNINDYFNSRKHRLRKYKLNQLILD